MADDRLGVQLVVEGLNAFLRDMQKAQRATDQTSDTLEELDKTTTRADKSIGSASRGVDNLTRSTQRSGSSMMGMVRNVRDVAQGFNETVAVVQRITATIDEFVSRGVEVGRARFQFELLAGGVSAAEAELREMQRAVGGTISEFDLMNTANAALNAGVVETVDELDEFVRMARVIELTSTAGASAVEELTLAAANMSTRRFDQLGLSLTRFKEIQEDVKEGADDLSKEEIWQESFWRLVTERADEMGSVLDEGVGSNIDKVRAQWTDFTDEIKEGAAEIVDAIAGIFVSTDDDFGGFVDNLIERAQRLGVEVAPEITDLVTGRGAATARALDRELGATLFGDTTAGLELAVAAAEDLEAQLPQLRAEADLMLAILREWSPATADVLEQQLELADTTVEQADAINNVAGSYRAYMQQLRTNEGVYARQGTLAADLNEDLIEQERLYRRAGAAGAAFAEPSISIDTMLDRLHAFQTSTRLTMDQYQELTGITRLAADANLSYSERLDAVAVVYDKFVGETERAQAAIQELEKTFTSPLFVTTDFGLGGALNLAGEFPTALDMVNDKLAVTTTAFSEVEAAIIGVNEEGRGLPAEKVEEFASASERAALAQEGLSEALGVTAATGLETDLFGAFKTGSEELDNQLGLLLGTTSQTEIEFSDLTTSMQAALEAGILSEDAYLSLAGALTTLLETGDVTADTLATMNSLVEQGLGPLAELAAAVETTDPTQFFAGLSLGQEPGEEGAQAKTGGISDIATSLTDALVTANQLTDTLNTPITKLGPTELGLTASEQAARNIQTILLGTRAGAPTEALGIATAREERLAAARDIGIVRPGEGALDKSVIVGITDELIEAADLAEGLHGILNTPLMRGFGPVELGLTESEETADNIQDIFITQIPAVYDSEKLGLDNSLETSVAISDELAMPVTKIVTIQLEGDAGVNIPFPGNQAGGPVLAGIPTIVGEAGPELFVPRTNGMILPNAATRAVMNDTGAGATGGTSRDTTINFNGAIMGPPEVAAQVRQATQLAGA